MSSPLSPRGRGAYQAFTLIELITVIAIVGVLSAITFGLARGATEQGKIGRAKAELATLASGLESYKQYFGDYLKLSSATETADDQISLQGFTPLATDRAYNFFRAMNGRLAPEHYPPTRRINKSDSVAKPVKYAKSFVDYMAFSFERDDRNSDAPIGQDPFPISNDTPAADDPDFANAFLDPWGNRYQYYYRDLTSPAVWRSANYILYSAGPDGQATVPPANGGLPDPTDPLNSDNIYVQP